MPDEELASARVLQIETRMNYITERVEAVEQRTHTHAGWLNRHNLEIAKAQQTIEELLLERLTAVETAVSELRQIVAVLASESKVLAWKVGAIIGGLMFAANQLASRIHL